MQPTQPECRLCHSSRALPTTLRQSLGGRMRPGREDDTHWSTRRAGWSQEHCRRYVAAQRDTAAQPRRCRAVCGAPCQTIRLLGSAGGCSRQLALTARDHRRAGRDRKHSTQTLQQCPSQNSPAVCPLNIARSGHESGLLEGAQPLHGADVHACGTCMRRQPATAADLGRR